VRFWFRRVMHKYSVPVTLKCVPSVPTWRKGACFLLKPSGRVVAHTPSDQVGDRGSARSQIFFSSSFNTMLKNLQSRQNRGATAQ
jgi:hypothetical protein